MGNQLVIVNRSSLEVTVRSANIPMTPSRVWRHAKREWRTSDIANGVTDLRQTEPVTRIQPGLYTTIPLDESYLLLTCDDPGCMLLGCILMNSSIYTWTMYERNQSCFVHVWLFSVGYILMFAPLFAKTWRLYRIFSSKQLAVQTWTDGKLFGAVCAPLLVLELIYLTIWSGVAPFEARTTVVDPIRPKYNFDSCYYNNTSQGFFLASLAYKIAFLVAGCALIFIARNIPSSFNETPFIGAAIYNVLFSSAILVPIVATDALGRESRFLVRSFGIMIATLLGQLIIVVPKMYHLIIYGDVKISLSGPGRAATRVSDHDTYHKHKRNSSIPLPVADSDSHSNSIAIPSGPNPYDDMSLHDISAHIRETQIKLLQLKQSQLKRQSSQKSSHHEQYSRLSISQQGGGLPSMPPPIMHTRDHSGQPLHAPPVELSTPISPHQIQLDCQS